MKFVAAARDGIATWRGRGVVARRLASLEGARTRDLRDEVEEWLAEFADRPALAAARGREALTFRGLFEAANRWSRWAILHGAGPGERIALLYPDRPERFAALLGIAATGGVATLLDPALAGADLAAALETARPERIAVDAHHLARFETATPHLRLAAAVWVDGPHAMAYPRLDEARLDLSGERLRPADRRALAPERACLRFVGHPDRAPIDLDHRGALRAMHAVSAACGARRDDRLGLAGDRSGGLEAALAPGLALTVGAVCVTGLDGAALAEDAARHDCTLLHLDRATAAATPAPSPAAPSTTPRLVAAAGSTPAPLARALFPGARRIAWTIAPGGDAPRFTFAAAD